MASLNEYYLEFTSELTKDSYEVQTSEKVEEPSAIEPATQSQSLKRPDFVVRSLIRLARKELLTLYKKTVGKWTYKRKRTDYYFESLV